MDVVPLVTLLVRNGVSQASIERTFRVAGDGLRRLAETEAAWWRSEILGPLFRAGIDVAEIGERTARFANESSVVTDAALMAIYHGQQGHAWMGNIFEGFEGLLDRVGLHERLLRPPAICFFDVTGYSRLTEERGDAEAAELAGRVARLVQRVAAQHRGRPIKWLGDGVMIHFPQAGAAVLAALDMLEGVAREGLPTGHVGIHAGPVLFQEGDYFGRTVNAAARIADAAKRSQVLVSQAVVDACEDADVTFSSIGPVELKGMLEPMVLFEATRPPA
jgi:class 3 adenylate cyclase